MVRPSCRDKSDRGVVSASIKIIKVDEKDNARTLSGAKFTIDTGG